MAKLCEGRVAIVTGAGRGIGREHALMLAEHGAKPVVNDLGGEFDGTGTDLTPAQQVAEEIPGMGGEAVVNGDDVSSGEGAAEPVANGPAQGVGQRVWTSPDPGSPGARPGSVAAPGRTPADHHVPPVRR